MVLACMGPDAGDGPSSAADTSTEPETGSPETGSTETSSSGTGESETGESETGPMCTGEVCTSTLTLSFAHTLVLEDGPHRLSLTTPLYDLICGIEPSPSGDKTCFGYAFADLSWTPELITVELTNAFFETVDYPSGEPFVSVGAELERGDELLWTADVPVEAGELIQPDPCGPPCWHALADATIE